MTTAPGALPEGIVLRQGKHPRRTEGVCLLEAVAWIAREKHTDHPKCACPVVAAFGRQLNDRMTDDAMRTELLLPLVPIIAGSRSTVDVEEKRRWMLVDWAVRTIAPRAFDAAARHRRMPKEHASRLSEWGSRLASAPEVTKESASSAAALCRSARAAAAADDAAAAAAYAAYAAYAAAAAAARRRVFAEAATFLRRVCEIGGQE